MRVQDRGAGDRRTYTVVQAPSRSTSGPSKLGDAVSVRVLIVDDLEPFRRAARAVVEATADFEVVGEAASGEASIEAAESLRPDIVLMDVNLPGVSGIEATRRIRAASPEVMVLLMSTREAQEFAGKAAECGAAGYLSKSSLTPEQLMELWIAAS
jgi:two-component system, NarL family, invasion response regulator UvrY